MDQLEGNPGALATRAEQLSASAKAIQEAAEALFHLTFVGTGDAIDVVAEKGGQLATQVKTAHGRYNGTASALSTFAVELQAAHSKANQAIEESGNSIQQYDAITAQLTSLRRLRQNVESADPLDPQLQRIDDRMRELAQLRTRYDNARNDAETKRAQAQSDLNAAAERAITRIDSALSSTNDGFWDHVGNFFADLGDLLASIGKWIADVLKTIITGILIAIAIVVALVILAVLLVALVKWLIFVFPALLAIAALLLLSLLIPGLEKWRTLLLAILVSVALPLVGGFLLWRVLSDLTAPTPAVTPLDPDDLHGKPRDAQRQAEDLPGFYSLRDYMNAEGYTDTMGGEDRTVVDIRKVMGPDGIERWVITLPSTQDWVAMHGDTGATNDLDSNLALMLTPEQQTQYERAVLQAMADAGIGKNDPVMLVGFSQGGIMAGHLAANRSDLYNFEAVLAYGAPIDAMNVPESTKVLSIQHTGDPVPTLDLTPPKPNTANHRTVQVDAYDGTTDFHAHDNKKYTDTASYSPEFAQYQDYFTDFSGAVVEQKQYTWKE